MDGKYWHVKESGSSEYKYIGLKGIEDIDDIVRIAEEDEGKASKEADIAKKDWQKAANDKGTKEKEKKANELYLKYTQVEQEHRTAKENVKKVKMQETAINRNKNKELKIERAKDVYTRKESIYITVMSGGKEDGRVITTIANVDKDIHELELYGIYIGAVYYYDELKRLIKDLYYELSPINKEFIENNLPANLIEDFVLTCKEQIINCGIKPTNGYYDVEVQTFNEWYKESGFTRFKLTELKEGLIIYDYCRHNRGRNDFTVSKKVDGQDKAFKVISFKAAKLKGLKDSE